jgi:heme/copper-type cytochrome/quinol oxidase subunit 2
MLLADSSTLSTQDTANAIAALGAMMGFIVIFAVGITVLMVWFFWRIFAKAGFSGPMGLLSLIPSVGPLVCIIILAFSRWPIEGPEPGWMPPPQPGPYPPPPPPPSGPPATL